MAHSIQPERIEADRDILLVLKDLPDYAPGNPALATPALVALDEALTRAEEATLLARKALEAARAAENAAAHEFHNAILGAKASVIAQYGRNGQPVAAIGLTKMSDRKRPVRRTREHA